MDKNTKKYKVYLKLNLVSLFFIGVSIISVTLAWFAYSGMASVQTEIDVKTWFIEFQKGNDVVSNDIVISLADIYPGMETTHESVKILNKGDSDAGLSYEIVSAAILDENIDNTTLTNDQIKDKLSHDYPFNINIGLSKNYALAHEDFSMFDVSISWPLDSGDDSLDSQWGSMAYEFQQNEIQKANNDSNYHKRSSIKVVISVKAEQYLEVESSSDINYSQGKLILYDIANDRSCEEISDTCIRTHVLDPNNKLGDSEVSLLPDLYGTYNEGDALSYNLMLPNWNVTMRPFTINDVLKVISNDVVNSQIVRDGLSDKVLGYAQSDERITDIVNKTYPYSGKFIFSNQNFNYLATNKCIWINSSYDNSSKYFALTKVDDQKSKVYGENMVTNDCSIVPVIVASKSNIN